MKEKLRRTAFISLKIALLLFFAQGVHAQTATISGNLQTLGVQNINSNGTFVRFSLRNFASNLPNVPGSTTIGWADQDFTPNASGNISGTIYQNSAISNSGTYYHVCVWYRNQLFRCVDAIINTSTWNLNSPTGLISSPVTGGPNQGFTQCFPFTQVSPANTWAIAHGLFDTNVIVVAYNGSGVQIAPASGVTITVVDVNDVTIAYGSPQSGTALVCHASQISIATNQPNAIITNPLAPQGINSQPLTLQGPFSLAALSANAGSCVQLGNGGQVGVSVTAAPCITSFAAEGYGASISQSAANNLAFIQQALNNASGGGEATLLTPGTFNISNSLVIGSSTKFRVGPFTRIKVVTGGQGVPVIVNNGFNTRASTTSITVTWTSGMTFSVGWTAHGLTCLNGNFPCVPLNPTYVWINGANQPQFDGVFLVQSVTDANDFVVSATRQPNTAATGTITGKFTDRDITIEGGVWDYNYPNNTIPSNTFNSSAFQFAIVQNLTIRNVKINNVQKYAINTNATRDLNIDGYASDFTQSDGIHVFGPAYNTRISHVDGHNGDDFVILDPTTDPNFPGFQIATTGGDVIDVIIENVTGENTGAGCVALYGPYGGFVETNITVRNIHCVARNAFVVNIAAGILYPSPAIFGNITLDHITGARDGGGQLIQIGGQSANIDTQIQNLTISNMEIDPNDISTFSSLVNVNHNTHIEHLSLINHTINPVSWANGGGHYAWTLDGSFGTVDIDGNVFSPAPLVIPPQARVFTFLGNFAVASATSSSQVGQLETVTTSSAHGFISGIWVTQAGSGVGACNGFFQVQAVPTTTTYTFNTTAAAGNCGAMTATPATVEKLNIRNNRFQGCGQINGLLTMANQPVITMTDNVINCQSGIVYTVPTTVWAQNNILNNVIGGLVQGGANTTITLNSIGNTLNGTSVLTNSGGFTVTINGFTCEAINTGCQFRSPVANLFPFGNINMQAANAQITTPFIQAGEIAANTTLASLSGTGPCATLASQQGGQNAGQVTCNGTTGTATLTITPGQTAPHGWSCSGSSASPALALANLGPFTTTTCVLSSGSTSLNSGTVITFGPLVAW